MGVRVADEHRTTNLSKQQANELCANKPLSDHYPLKAHFPPRYVEETVSEAELVPINFINLVNQKRYDEAFSLLSPNLRRFYSGQTGHEALINIKHITLLKIKDTTKIEPVTYYLSRHFAIKTYGAILDKEVYNPKLLTGWIGLQVNNFVVIKYTPQSPWLIDAQTGLQSSTAKLWGLDIKKR